MAGPSEKNLHLGPPERWLQCPRKGQLVENKFLPFKTPLCAAYDDQIDEMYRFHPKMVFGILQSSKQQIGLWIDLTNTERFYPSAEVEAEGARYVKLQCRGHGESPSPENASTFVQICQDFWRQPGNKGKIAAVHCTHGFNRTGFLISAFLTSVLDWDIGAAVLRFAEARPPGIYKQDYINDLFQRYGEEEDKETPLAAPPLPEWSSKAAVELNDDECAMEGTSEGKDVPFFDGHVAAVTRVADAALRTRLQKRIQEICHWTKRGFPGGQPVSMDRQNVLFLEKKEYKVSWKADGVRYMMLIEDADKIYMFDRDNTPYHVPGLVFPHRKEDRHIRETLIDGEMVLDEENGQKIPRFLIYDMIVFENDSVGGQNFRIREERINKELMEARNAARARGTLDASKEPFKIRQKMFYDLVNAAKLLSAKFVASVAHETDGLIFQPVADPYLTGRTEAVLKWKPPHLNSVDFQLRVRKEQAPGMLPEWKGFLHVLHMDAPFAQLPKLTKDLKALDGKIIECTVDQAKGVWVFLRERVDKSFPNALTTAQGVCESIKNPVTEEGLLGYIAKIVHRENEAKRKRAAAGNGGMAPPKKLAPQPS